MKEDDFPYPQDFSKGKTFYYDESNNIRKLRLSNGVLSTPQNKRYFVLGGLLTSNGINPQTSRLLAALNLQKTVKEIKFRNLSPSRDLQSVLESKRIQAFFNWLRKEKILVHFQVMDWIYYSLVDIVDSLAQEECDTSFLSLYHHQIKTALYDVANQDIDFFMSFLASFNYPNIQKGKERLFLEGLQSIVGSAEPLTEPGEDFFVDCLMQMIKAAKKHEGLPFIQDNEPGDLIDSFSANYVQSIKLFPNCFHILDQEVSVAREIEEISGTLKNYAFKDSKTDLFIQLSDVFVGFLVSLLDFSRAHSEEEIACFVERLSADEKQALHDFHELIDDSDSFSEKTISNAIPLSASKKIAMIYRTQSTNDECLVLKPAVL